MFFNGGFVCRADADLACESARQSSIGSERSGNWNKQNPKESNPVSQYMLFLRKQQQWPSKFIYFINGQNARVMIIFLAERKCRVMVAFTHLVLQKVVIVQASWRPNLALSGVWCGDAEKRPFSPQGRYIEPVLFPGHVVYVFSSQSVLTRAHSLGIE